MFISVYIYVNLQHHFFIEIHIFLFFLFFVWELNLDKKKLQSVIYKK